MLTLALIFSPSSSGEFRGNPFLQGLVESSQWIIWALAGLIAGLVGFRLYAEKVLRYLSNREKSSQAQPTWIKSVEHSVRSFAEGLGVMGHLQRFMGQRRIFDPRMGGKHLRLLARGTKHRRQGGQANFTRGLHSYHFRSGGTNRSGIGHRRRLSGGHNVGINKGDSDGCGPHHRYRHSQLGRNHGSCNPSRTRLDGAGRIVSPKVAAMGYRGKVFRDRGIRRTQPSRGL